MIAGGNLNLVLNMWDWGYNTFILLSMTNDNIPVRTP